MNRNLAALATAALAACAGAHPASAPAPEAMPAERAVQLARVRCLLVAPFENASDEPLIADAATGALVSAIDPVRTTVYPIEELRALFKGTPLELPEGVSASLALELGEVLAADAVLYGAVEGRAHGPDAEATLTLRLAATGARDTLFARVVEVARRPGESMPDAARRAALEAAEPILQRIGVPGRKICFERQRLDRVRLLAVAGDRPPPPSSAVTAPLPPPPPPVTATASRVTAPRATAPAAQSPAPAVARAAPAAPSPATGVARAAPAPAAPPSAGAPSAAGSTVSAGAALTGASAAAATGAALTHAATAPASPAVAALPPPPPPPAPRPAPRAASAPPRLTERQRAWAAKLAAGERVLVEDVSFDGRSPRLERDAGLADLAAALAARPGVHVRLEGFVDAGKSERDDLRDSMGFARAAGRRLLELGVARDRVTWAGRGGESPLAPNFTLRGRTANRRVEAVGVR